MKYVILILLGLTIGYLSSTVFLTKREPVQTIVTITCKEMDGYGEDPETGERYLVVWNECDTTYNTK